MGILIIECKMCHHRYGAWRPQCQACGHPTPKQEEPLINDALSRALREPRRVKPRERAQRAPAKSTCAFCRVRGAKEICPTCGALIHSTCKRLHDATHSAVTA